MSDFLVGAEFALDGPAPDLTLLAHAIPNLGQSTILGVTLCDVPVETLTLIPDLSWDDVLTAHRCAQCQAQASPNLGWRTN